MDFWKDHICLCSMCNVLLGCRKKTVLCFSLLFAVMFMDILPVPVSVGQGVCLCRLMMKQINNMYDGIHDSILKIAFPGFFFN